MAIFDAKSAVTNSNKPNQSGSANAINWSRVTGSDLLNAVMLVVTDKNLIAPPPPPPEDKKKNVFFKGHVLPAELLEDKKAETTETTSKKMVELTKAQKKIETKKADSKKKSEKNQKPKVEANPLYLKDRIKIAESNLAKAKATVLSESNYRNGDANLAKKAYFNLQRLNNEVNQLKLAEALALEGKTLIHTSLGHLKAEWQDIPADLREKVEAVHDESGWMINMSDADRQKYTDWGLIAPIEEKNLDIEKIRTRKWKSNKWDATTHTSKMRAAADQYKEESSVEALQQRVNVAAAERAALLAAQEEEEAAMGSSFNEAMSSLADAYKAPNRAKQAQKALKQVHKIQREKAEDKIRHFTRMLQRAENARDGNSKIPTIRKAVRKASRALGLTYVEKAKKKTTNLEAVTAENKLVWNAAKNQSEWTAGNSLYQMEAEQIAAREPLNQLKQKAKVAKDRYFELATSESANDAVLAVAKRNADLMLLSLKVATDRATAARNAEEAARKAKKKKVSLISKFIQRIMPTKETRKAFFKYNMSMHKGKIRIFNRVETIEQAFDECFRQIKKAPFGVASSDSLLLTQDYMLEIENMIARPENTTLRNAKNAWNLFKQATKYPNSPVAVKLLKAAGNIAQANPRVQTPKMIKAYEAFIADNSQSDNLREAAIAVYGTFLMANPELRTPINLSGLRDIFQTPRNRAVGSIQSYIAADGVKNPYTRRAAMRVFAEVLAADATKLGKKKTKEFAGYLYNVANTDPNAEMRAFAVSRIAEIYKNSTRDVMMNEINYVLGLAEKDHEIRKTASLASLKLLANIDSATIEPKLIQSVMNTVTRFAKDAEITSDRTFVHAVYAVAAKGVACEGYICQTPQQMNLPAFRSFDGKQSFYSDRPEDGYVLFTDANHSELVVVTSFMNHGTTAEDGTYTPAKEMLTASEWYSMIRAGDIGVADKKKSKILAQRTVTSLYKSVVEAAVKNQVNDGVFTQAQATYDKLLSVANHGDRILLQTLYMQKVGKITVEKDTTVTAIAEGKLETKRDFTKINAYFTNDVVTIEAAANVNAVAQKEVATAVNWTKAETYTGAFTPETADENIYGRVPGKKPLLGGEALDLPELQSLTAASIGKIETYMGKGTDGASLAFTPERPDTDLEGASTPRERILAMA